MNLSDKIIQKKYEEGFFQNMDPLAKIILSVIYFISIPFIKNIFSLLIVASINFLYLIIARLYKETCLILVLIFISFLFTYLVEYIMFSNPTDYLTYVRLYLTILPIMCIGLILGLTTDTLSLLYSLNRIRFLKPISYPIIITMRYISIMRFETGKILDGLKIRGLNLKPSDFILKPLMTIKLLILPILLRGFLTGERMAAIAEIKGFSSKIEPTRLKEHRFGKKEYLFVFTNIFILSILIFYDRVQKFFF